MQSMAIGRAPNGVNGPCLQKGPSLVDGRDIVGYCLSSENMEVRIDEAMSTADAPAAAMRETER